VSPTHHLPDELLLAYATGGLEEAESLLVATHGSLCPRCARRVTEHERLSGALLAAREQAAVSDDLLSRTLAQLDRTPPVVQSAPPRDRVLPAPLARITGPFEQIRWKRSLPNVLTLELPLTLGGVPVRLRRFDPGSRIPEHTHRAPEYDMVLTGGVTDNASGKHFVRGDVSANDASDAHSLTIDEGEACVALSVHAARVKPLGLWARLVFGYTRW
jgi:putative transcriptional regulator